MGRPDPAPDPGRGTFRLEGVVRTLRARDAFNRRQRPSELVNALAREVSELRAAVHAGSVTDVTSELGDVLFNLLALVEAYHERGDLSLKAADRTATRRMIERHPHVFAGAPVPSRAGAISQWKSAKRAELARMRASVAATWVSGLVPLAGVDDATELARLTRRCAAALGLGERAHTSTVRPGGTPAIAAVGRSGGVALDLVDGGETVLMLGWVHGWLDADRATRTLRTVLGPAAEVNVRLEHHRGRA